MTVDFSNGDPLPASGLSFDGGTHNLGDTLRIVGTAGDDTVMLAAAGLQFASSDFLDSISYSNVQQFGFDLGGGADSLIVSGTTLRMPDDEAISAGTAVTVQGGGVLDLGGHVETIERRHIARRQHYQRHAHEQFLHVAKRHDHYASNWAGQSCQDRNRNADAYGSEQLPGRHDCHGWHARGDLCRRPSGRQQPDDRGRRNLDLRSIHHFVHRNDQLVQLHTCCNIQRDNRDYPRAPEPSVVGADSGRCLGVRWCCDARFGVRCCYVRHAIGAIVSGS